MPKKTPFYEKHLKNNAKIIEFAGFLMPAHFEGVIPEHEAVRNSVGVFDVSHMGEIEITGPERIQFVNYITTNDVSKLALNQVQYSTMLYPDGGIVDDLLVYNLLDRILLVVNAANTDKDYEWIVQNKKFNVEIMNLSDEIGQLAIQGPKSEQLMQKIVNFDLSQLKYYWAIETEINGFDVLLSRTGYTGEDGFEVYMDAEDGLKIWDIIFDAGKDLNVKPIGLGARDTLRSEMRYCLYGNDIDKTTNPLEAGLGWIVKFDKGDFIGKDALLKIKESGIKRKLVGFEVIDKGIPRPHQKIIDENQEIGYVTSGTFSPSLKKGIGMGYVEIKYAEPGTKFKVMAKEPIPVEVIKGPFYKKGTHK
ncbi:MAG: glycine cleavage system aminomethyltransferase GcvT [candidate division WOR-3 bacterium]|nr:glycine cleavage system aminomethyltransferase GcvT [candidate division WOR-3 bacterium]